MDHLLLTRRRLLQAAATTPLWLNSIPGEAESAADLPPVFYSNDTTNITSCVSPWRNPKDGFTDDHLRASITEAKGAGVHLLQPGLGWIPWWKSKLYSASDHYETFLGQFGETRHNAYARHLLAGGDLVRTFIDQCRTLGVKAFVSYRLNDGHHVRGLPKALAEKRPAHDMSRHFWENYESYRIGPDPADWGQGVFNWAIPAVPAHKLALISELSENYPLDGLELDFLRHWIRFPATGTTVEERRKVTTGFVREIRQMLDRTAGTGPRRTLCIRVPAALSIHDDQGIHLPSLVAAGVDVVTLSWSYFTFQDESVRRVREIIPDTPVYAEMTHTTMTGKALSGSGTQPYLRTTDEQFYTTAHLAYSQGAAGVSLFNFPYYREHSTPAIGPFTEPPFHVVPKLGNRDFVARQPHSYFLTSARKDPVLPDPILPVMLQRDAPEIRFIEMALVPGHHCVGVLRLRSDEDIADRELEVSLNGTPLKEIPFVAELLPHPYQAYTGRAEEIRCYACPVELTRKGANEISLSLQKGIRVRVIYLEILFPAT
jgi:hypothetical protein